MLRQEKMVFARGAAADGMVLLKNDNGALPLDKNKEIALFGTCAYRCFRLGWGSGDMMAQSISQINEGLKDAGYKLNNDVEAFCLDAIKDLPDQRLMNRSWDEWTWRQEEIKIVESMIAEAAKTSEVAVVTVPCGPTIMSAMLDLPVGTAVPSLAEGVITGATYEP